ncbi:MAG: hypothetical protein C3F12_05640 [Candidatus Methylomirabilota bacterium]|nr:MAG: hypothetical protein C3F12_05640 [candidate division NC10 bacterium]
MFHPFHSLLSIKKEGKKQMKSLTKGILASMLAVAPLVAAVGTASANTELVPAARLAIPYWDVTSGKSTLILLTNVSRFVDLTGAPMTDGVTTLTGQVHIEWYDKSCTRTDVPVELSPGDVDQLDLTNPSLALPGTQGYADIDVRDTATTTGTSVQFNVLLGTVVIGDSTNDFAIAYPAASGIGSSTLGVGGNIVARANDGSGNAAVGGWTGSFEPFPARVFVPMFFAEGGPINTQSLLAIAALPNGNWAGGALGEPPGADAVSTSLINPGTLITANTEVFDGCENHSSRPISGHYILSSLGSLFGTIINQTNWHNILPEDCHGVSNFPHVDEASGAVPGAFIGWIDIPNSADIGPLNVAGLSTRGDAGDEFDRGMVGVLVESNDTAQGDVTRLWGDPAGGGDHLNVATGSRNTRYTNVDFVDHCDIDASIDTAAEFFLACFGF